MKKRLVAFALCVMMIFGLGEQVPLQAAATMHESVQLNPYVVQTAEEKDLYNAMMNKYNFSTNGEEIVPLTVPQDGCVIFSMTVAKGGFVHMQLFEKEDCTDIPKHITCHCPYDTYRMGQVQMYMTKGTYYIRFPKNTYDLGVHMYSNETCEITDSGMLAGYCDDRNALIYTYKAKKDGYLTLSDVELNNNTSSVQLQVCDTKGNPLTEAKTFSLFHGDKQIYAVGANHTYQFKLRSVDTNGTSFFQFHYKFTERKDSSADKKKKATSIKVGKKVSGTVLAEESAKKADWYKVVIKKNQKLEFQYSGSVSSGTIVFEVFDSKGNAVMDAAYIESLDSEGKATLHKASGGATMGKGTYYVKVTKNIKSTSGIYTWLMISK